MYINVKRSWHALYDFFTAFITTVWTWLSYGGWRCMSVKRFNERQFLCSLIHNKSFKIYTWVYIFICDNCLSLSQWVFEIKSYVNSTLEFYTEHFVFTRWKTLIVWRQIASATYYLYYIHMYIYTLFLQIFPLWMLINKINIFLKSKIFWLFNLWYIVLFCFEYISLFIQFSGGVI